MADLPQKRESMRKSLKFLIAMVASLVVMLLFRALFITVYTVSGSALEPMFKHGDRVVVNRWSYGLRTGGEGLFSYGRLCKQMPAKGDYIAVENSLGEMVICRCTALPGDTVTIADKGRIVMSSKAQCAAHDCYYLDNIGVVAEENIVGRVVMVLYNHQARLPFWRGFDIDRFFLLR